MIQTLLARFALFAATALLVVLPSLPATAQFEQFDAGDCMSNRALQSAIASGDVPPVRDVLEMGPGDELLSVELCEGGGNSALAYKVRVLDRYGEANTLVLPIDGDRR